jgi:hypothetical protein
MAGALQTRWLRRATLACCTLVALAGSAGATENNGTVRPLGLATIRSGVMPEPGLRLNAVAGYFHATKTVGSDGDPRPGVSNFDLEISGAVVLLQYVWPNAKLLGSNVETRLGYTLYSHIDSSFDTTQGGGLVHRAGTRSGSGDTLFAPISLGWHTDTYYHMVGVEFFLPTGPYDPTPFAPNVGRGYWAWAPQYRFSWFPTSALELSGNLNYLINYENPDTHYRSGRELVLDYGIGYTLAPSWQAGVAGYLYKQVSDDKRNGTVFLDGNRGQAVGIGPFVRFYRSSLWGVTFKWQTDTAVENRAVGNRFNVQFSRQLF